MTSKLINAKRNSKTYWSLLKHFLNHKKVPLIPPLFHEDKFVTDFLKKAKIFHVLFAKRCSLIKNNSKLYLNLLQYLANNCLSSVSFSQDNITKKIQNLDRNKAHGLDNINIRMLKMCGSSVYKPLETIFKKCIEISVFVLNEKKINIVPIHKKGEKQTLAKYRPWLLLPVCRKIPKRFLFNGVFKCFIENKHISSN